MTSLVQNQLRKQLVAEMTRFKADVFQILENSIIQEKGDFASIISEIDRLKEKVFIVEKQSIINSQIPKSDSEATDGSKIDPTQLKSIDKKIEIMKIDLLNELDKHTNSKIDTRLKGIGEQVQGLKKNDVLVQSQIDKLQNDNTLIRKTFNQYKIDIDSELHKQAEIVSKVSSRVSDESKWKEKLTGLRADLESLKSLVSKNSHINENQTKKIELQSEEFKVKIQNLEKLVDGLKNLTINQNNNTKNQEASSQKVSSPGVRKQTAGLNMNENELLKKLRMEHESFGYRLETLRYDVDSMKDNIVRERRRQKDYNDRICYVENKIDTLSQRDTIGSKSNYSSSRQQNNSNFMSNNSMASNFSELNRMNRFNGGEEYGQPLQALLNKEDRDHFSPDYHSHFSNLPLSESQKFSSVQNEQRVEPVQLKAMTPQNTQAVDIKNGKSHVDNEKNQNIGFDMDDPSFLQRFGSNATGYAPPDEEFDTNISVIKETEQSNIIEFNEFKNYLLEGGRDSLRNSLKGTQTVTSMKAVSKAKASKLNQNESGNLNNNLQVNPQNVQVISSVPTSNQEKISLNDHLKFLTSQNTNQDSDGQTLKIGGTSQSRPTSSLNPKITNELISNKNPQPLSTIDEEVSNLSTSQEQPKPAASKENKHIQQAVNPTPKSINTQVNSSNNMNSSFKIKPSVLNQSIQNINPNQSMAIDYDNDDSITLQVDDNGFLLDKEGYPILDDEGQPIKLSEENIEFFKENDLYSEEVIDDN